MHGDIHIHIHIRWIKTIHIVRLVFTSIKVNIVHI